MRAVEHAQLGEFERHHVLDELCAGFLPCRTSRRKAVFDHPLTERLAWHGHGVFCLQRGERRFAIGVGGGGDDAIHHRRRERDMRVDPVGEFAVDHARERNDRLFQRGAVMREVVA